MFSALTQGSLIYVLDKTDRLKFKVGEVIGITQPKYNTDFNISQSNTQTYVDIKVKLDNYTTDFNNIPSSSSIISYNNGKLILSETKQGLQNEVESTLHNSKEIVDNIDFYKNSITDCESILKELNPQFAKDAERDEQISSLKDEMSTVKNTLNKLVDMLSSKTN